MPKKRNNTALGSSGENFAIKLLTKNNFKVIDKNYRLPYGEIDLIATKFDTLYFVEVKTRSSDRYGLPEEAVTKYKIARIKKAAYTYIQDNNNLPDKHMILVVAIIANNGIVESSKIIEVS